LNFALAFQLTRNMGLRYTCYRIRHELEKRLGILKKRHPISPNTKTFIPLLQWNAAPCIFPMRQSKRKPGSYTEESLLNKTDKILQGKMLFFSREWKTVVDWNTNPDTGYIYNVDKHWSEIPDLTPEAGDIKFVWEKSRFSYCDYSSGKDFSEFVFAEIESWIDNNPVNQGPNWRCSQEISLRIFNWAIVLDYYKGSEALSEVRWEKIQNVIYWSLHHVYNHIDFSRIAVRNNHAITETLFLTLSHILFPYIPETIKWQRKGRKWFEDEIAYQIYEDGTFLQFSMNYHRVVVQLLSLGISVADKGKLHFSSVVYERAYKSLNFLFQCSQDENGWLPNYGSNDGAWFFPLSETDYRDYRPQLNTLHYYLTGQHLYEDSTIRDDSLWFPFCEPKDFKPLIKQQGCLSFDLGGYYTLRHNDTFTFIRCGNHKDRPAQADNLHVDVWHKGENVLRDSGTYKYNTEQSKLDYFMGSLSHNTVMVENHSQMLKGGRFIWYFWTQKHAAFWQEDEEKYVFQGEIQAFRFLRKDARHLRKVEISKRRVSWKVEDQITNLDDLMKKQIWHVDGDTVKISSSVPAETFKSYKSDYYGEYTEEQSIFFTFNQKIETQIKVVE
jgi:hypothetical protein